jgi:hypothetical protein
LSRKYRPTNPTFESGILTPYKEIETAAAERSDHELELDVSALTDSEWAEVRRIGALLGVQIDGKNATVLKGAAQHAGLTLSHLRWFLRNETFSGAKNRMAVLLTIVKEFRERATGIVWRRISL